MGPSSSCGGKEQQTPGTAGLTFLSLHLKHLSFYVIQEWDDVLKREGGVSAGDVPMRTWLSRGRPRDPEEETPLYGQSSW